MRPLAGQPCPNHNSITMKENRFLVNTSTLCHTVILMLAFITTLSLPTYLTSFFFGFPPPISSPFHLIFFNILFFSQTLLMIRNLYLFYFNSLGLPRWPSGEGSACQCRRSKRCRFDLWVRKLPQSRKWQPAPVFLPGSPQMEELRRLQSIGLKRDTPLSN